MERYTNTILNKQGKPVAGAVVTVTTYPGNEPAVIYSADGGQPVESVSSDENGRFGFYAADGHYNLSISGKHVESFTITDVVLNDPNNDLSPDALRPIKDDLDTLQLPDYAALRAYRGPRRSVYVTGVLGAAASSGIAGMFVRDDADTTSADNGGTVVVAAGGKRFKRAFDGAVDVRWFGAKGDGSTDDTAAIQRAIDYVAEKGGGIVTGPADVVFPVVSIAMRSNVELRGIRLKSLVRGTDDSATVTFPEGVVRCGIRNVWIDGNRANQTMPKISGVRLRGIDTYIVDCEIFDAKKHAIDMRPGCEHFVIRGNTLRDSDGAGISLVHSATVACKHGKIHDNKIYRVGETGIGLSAGDENTGLSSAGCQYTSICGNHVKDTGLLTIAGGIGGYSKMNHHLLFANNVLENVNNHMFHVGGNHITVTGNIGKNITTAGITVRNWPNNATGAETSYNINISNNQIHGMNNPEGEAIYVSNCEGVVVAGNVMSGIAGTAIRLRGQDFGRTNRTSDATVTGNVIIPDEGLSAGLYGIHIDDADRVSIHGNIVRGAEKSGIAISGSTGVSLSANTSTGSKTGSGLFIAAAGSNGSVASTQIDATGNTFSGNAGFGIQKYGAATNVIELGNILFNNASGPTSTPVSGQLAFNIGYRTRNRGTATVANGGTITHNLSLAPTSYRATATKANRVIAVTAASSTTLTISLTDLTGAAITTAESVNWEASAELS